MFLFNETLYCFFILMMDASDQTSFIIKNLQ